MKTAIRWVVIGVVGAAAVPYAAYAGSPMSNGVGGGRANAPSASQTPGAAEPRGSAARGRPAEVGGHGKVAGRRAAHAGPARSTNPTAQPAGDRAFVQNVWTAP